MSPRRSKAAALVVGLLLAAAMGPTVAAASLATGAPPGEDPLAHHQWALAQVGAPQAWTRATGQGVVVAVVDSGVDHLHADLFEPDPDDPKRNVKFVPGRTFSASCPSGCDQPVRSTHGTHVAGIIAAVAGNGVGIAGVAPEARLMSLPIQVTGAHLASAVRWAVDHGAHVVNLSVSLSFYGVNPNNFDLYDHTPVEEALDYAAAEGTVVIAAAGNQSLPSCRFPASHAATVCVAATTRNQTRGQYSNTPLKPDLRTVVAAPGGLTSNGAHPCTEDQILSTFPATLGQGPECGLPAAQDYRYLGGTSMATPHVAGVAALLVSMGCTRADVLELLRSTSRTPGPVAALDIHGAWTPDLGWGIVDADRATAAAETRCAQRGT